MVISPGQVVHKIIRVHHRTPLTVTMARSNSAIVVGRRVSARRGPFLPLLAGQRRAQRARKYGNTVESVDAHTWKVLWDDGVVSVEKSAALRVEMLSAGLEPPPPATHSAAASTQIDRIDPSYVPFNLTESQAHSGTPSGTAGSAGWNRRRTAIGRRLPVRR